MKYKLMIANRILTIFLLLNASLLQAQITLILDDIPDDTPANGIIYLASNANQWNPADKDFQFTLNEDKELYLVIDSLEMNKKVLFKFTLGTWDLVETNLDGSDISNRELTYLESDTIHLKIGAWQNAEIAKTVEKTASYNVEIINDSFYIPQLDRYRRIWIYLPPDYTIESDSAYPVLYMHDGQNLFDNSTSFSGEWGVDESLNELFEEGVIVPIVIGIDHGGSRRINEYCVEVAEEYSDLAEGELYLDFIINTLKPEVDKRYRTKPQREYSGIMGSSLGGLISTYAILDHSDTFGLAGLFSSSYLLADSIFSIPINMQSPIRIFSSCGGEEKGELIEAIIKMDSLFLDNVENKENIYLEIVEGGEHNEQFWSSIFKEAIIFLFKP
jgi:predicted alpha/beta superfamily hydrolase